MAKVFASQTDLEAKQIASTQLSPNAYAYTAEGDPNSGVVIGDDSVLIVDTTAMPAMAQDLIACIRAITNKSVKHAVLSHYHAVRVLGASVYFVKGAQNIIASRGTYEIIVECGEAGMKSKVERFSRPFVGVETVSGLTWPTLVFERELTLFLGRLEVKILHPDPGHTKDDTVVWIPSQKMLFSGDLIEYDATCHYSGAQPEEWPATLDALRAFGVDKLVPGRSPVLPNPGEVDKGLAYTRDFVSTLLQHGKETVTQKMDLKIAMAHTHMAVDPKFGSVLIYKHCLSFDVTCTSDEASGIKHPRIQTAERDREMWAAPQG